MKIIERACQENLQLKDKFSVDEDGIERLVECGNVEAMKKSKEEKQVVRY